MYLLIFAIICNIIPLIILPFFYDIIPNLIPAFVDLTGSPTRLMEKTYFTILRLPIMGILLSSICFIMHTEKAFLGQAPSSEKKTSKLMWPVIAIIISLKTGITSLEMLFTENEKLVSGFRVSVLALVVIGVLILSYWFFKMYKNNQLFSDDKNDFSKNKLLIIGGIILVYIIIIFMPYFSR